MREGMDDFRDQIRTLSPQRLALLAVKLKEQLDRAQRVNEEPIAVMGIGCRFPSADGPEAFWDLLQEGREGIRNVPADRWSSEYYDADPAAPGKMVTLAGGFLDRIDEFDPKFFGIAPREALVMDPQQRLLLEVAWEALENAGLAPGKLSGSRTGVFVGICNTDYHQLLMAGSPATIDAYVASGNAHSVAGGRLSYVLGLQGPCMSIDTSCSASLVAIHSACQSLRNGESSMALAGGVNVICAPETSIALSKGNMLAPDGRCKTFDAAADGFSRGEGCGIVVLKRLSDAKRDGDRILALVRGSAINQDGRSGGLTVPSGPAQETVIRDALAMAGLSGTDIDYVEAHGTGTSLGDPIEVHALARVLGAGRDRENPLLIGSVKTNIGHLESAAGVAGFIKVVLSLQHEILPNHLNFDAPNPYIDWTLPVTVTKTQRSWRRTARPRRAGVSSFGFSGTNAHAILEEAPQAEDPVPTDDRPLHCVTVSAQSETGLRRLSRLYADALAQGISLPNLAYTAGSGRTHMKERLAIVAADAQQASSALLSASTGRPCEGLYRGSADRARDIVFLYTGAGAQYPRMGEALYRSSPVFREAIDHCDRLIGADRQGRTLSTVLAEAADDSPIHAIEWTQPAMFAVEYALSTLWRSWGVEPAAVIGHSVGEYAAACAAGVFSLEDGLRLITERGRLLASLPPGGQMASVFAEPQEVAAAIAPLANRVAIAAVNGPANMVISGEAEAVDKVLADFASRNVMGQRLFVSLAAHSPLVDPALDAMEDLARSVQMSAPSIPIAWNLTGRPLSNGMAPDALYWRRHMREPVRFADGIRALYDEGFRTFLEVGPHPALLASVRQCLSEEGCVFLTSLRRGKDDWAEMLASFAELHVKGGVVDFTGFDRPYARRRVALPTYPFERERYWAAPPPRNDRPSAVADGAVKEAGGHLADGLFYRLNWERATHSVGPAALHRWIIIAEANEVVRRVCADLKATGDMVSVVQPSQWRAAAASSGGLVAAPWWPLPEELVNGSSIEVVYLNAIGSSAPSALAHPSRDAMIFLKSAASLSTGRVWLVTRGAQEVRGQQDVVAPDLAGMWGLGRTFALECPRLWGGLLDLDPLGDDSGLAAALLDAAADDIDDQSAWRAGKRYVPRLCTQPPPVARSMELRQDRSYLITGGMGGIGLAIAGWMVSRGARHIVLMGRTPVPPPSEWSKNNENPRLATLAKLRDAGVNVLALAVDVGDDAAMTEEMAAFGQSLPPLGGVIHAAVASTASSIADMDLSVWDAMFDTKVGGANLIERLTASQPLDFLVNFSTTTALLGSVDLAHYAAANAVLDAMASRLRAKGRPALTVNWGSWNKLNVSPEARERIARGGLRPMATDFGIAALESLLAAGEARAVVADVNWLVLLSAYESRRPQPMLSRMTAEDAAHQGKVADDESITVNLTELSSAERRNAIDGLVNRVAVAVLGLARSDTIDSNISLFKMGLDSLMAIQVQRRLEKALGETLPSALVFNHPTASALIDFVDQIMAARLGESDSQDDVGSLLARVDQMSGEEVDALLSKMLVAGGAA
jgi:acyl transferase domain-containing protein